MSENLINNQESVPVKQHVYASLARHQLPHGSHPRPPSDYPVVPNTHLSVLLQEQLERLHVVVEAEDGHGEQQILAVDGLPLLLVAPVARLARHKTDKLRDALLHALPRLLGDLTTKNAEMLEGWVAQSSNVQVLMVFQFHFGSGVEITLAFGTGIRRDRHQKIYSFKIEHYK